MNLEKLFETQKVLRERINYQGEDRFNKLVLALLVELGECANEWRGFKFWSKDQEPRVKVPVTAWGEPYKNPLLEEYVDCLHFVLELGLEKGYCDPDRYLFKKEKNAADSFLTVMEIAIKYDLYPNSDNYSLLFERFKELGEHLGFTWEKVEKAYYDKNSINHKRQDEGY
jgi:dimeric dUTPase (all-alpha-NTP-PPase superfamily)